MATWVRTQSGNTVTYTITDTENNTLAVNVLTNQVTGNSITMTSTGGLRQDGQQLLSQLMLQLQTGLLPNSIIPGSNS